MVGTQRIVTLGTLGIVLLNCLSCVPVENYPDDLVGPPPPRATPTPKATLPEEPPAATASPKRFQDTVGGQGESRTQAESVVELSERFAALHEEAAVLRDEKRALTEANETLKQRVASLEAKLEQAQLELTEANDLLMEILVEMNDWKKNVLGYRNEMRQAAKAELEALLKILEILGADVEDPNLGSATDATSVTVTEENPN